MIRQSYLKNISQDLSRAIIVALYVTIPAPIIAQTLPPASPPESVAAESAYVLGPGDQIEIAVFGYEEYTGAKTILSDGTITLPVIGIVAAANRTPEQLAQELSSKLQAYLVDPVTTVSLSTLRPVVVNVAGEVQRPGPVELRGLTNAASNSSDASNTSTPTVSSALMKAGGITQSADIRQVVVRRVLPDGTSSTSTINLWDALLSDQAPQDLILQDGDSILVPRLVAGETIDRRLIARSSLSPGTVRVRVVGEVKNPGEIQVPPDSSLSSAVAIAGGPTNDARLSRVAFIRMNEQGKVERQTVDLQNLTDTYQVQDGDVIIVSKRTSSSILDGVGRVLSPLTGIFNLFNLLGF